MKQGYLIQVINHNTYEAFTTCAHSKKIAERRFRKLTKTTDPLESFCVMSAPDKSGITYQVTTIRNLKKGEYFKALDSKGRPIQTVYVKDVYDHSTNCYMAYKFSDISSAKSFNADTRVIIDFTF